MLPILGINTMSTINNGSVIMSSVNFSDGSVVYPLTHNLVDYFWGFAWENVARFKWNGKEWELRSKTSSLPRGFITALESYRKGK